MGETSRLIDSQVIHRLSFETLDLAWQNESKTLPVDFLFNRSCPSRNLPRKGGWDQQGVVSWFNVKPYPRQGWIDASDEFLTQEIRILAGSHDSCCNESRRNINPI